MSNVAKERARNLRGALTDSERRVWRLLRTGDLSALNFRRQAPLGPYVLDFVSHPARLVVEVDGAHHAERAQAAHDAKRTAFLEAQGYRVFRLWNSESRFNRDNVWSAIHALALETPARGRMERWRTSHAPAAPSMGEEAPHSGAGGGEARNVDAKGDSGAPQETNASSSRRSPHPAPSAPTAPSRGGLSASGAKS